MTKDKLIAIVWAPEEARTAMFATRLNAKLYNIHYLQYKRPLVAPLKYIFQSLKTWQVLFQERPRFVYVTNPPVFAVLCVFVYCRLFGAAYIMDTHPPALYSRKWGWTLPLQHFLIRFAYVNVVDQERFKRLFESWGGKTVILERPPKDLTHDVTIREVDPGQFDITVINTFAADEPIETLIEAARQLPHVRFFVLGDLARAKPALLRDAPNNVVFTGYLRGSAYSAQLRCSRGVLVQTTYPYSLLGGAQDAVALGKPLILSRQPALTEYFKKGSVFVDNEARSIVSGIETLQQQEHQLTQEIVELREEQGQQWETNFQKLVELLHRPDLSVSPSTGSATS